MGDTKIGPLDVKFDYKLNIWGFTIMKRTTLGSLLFSLMLLVATQAQALVLTPDGEYTNELYYPAYSNPDAADISAITGFTSELLYKDNVGGAEEGMANFMASYDTTYTDTATDPANAFLTFTGGDVMTDASWLLVKDGNHAPSWYLFDISGWNGTEDIQMLDFWPAQGAISHISIFGSTSTSVPEASSIYLLAFGLVGLFGMARRKI